MEPESIKAASDPVVILGWLKMAGLMLLAMIAGALGYIMRMMDAQLPVKWPRVMLEAASAGLVGLLIILLCQQFHASIQITGISTGVFGWLGAKATIQVLQRLVWDKLGLNRSKDNVPAE